MLHFTCLGCSLFYIFISIRDEFQIFINPSKLNDLAVMLATYVESNYFDARDYSGFYCDVALHVSIYILLN